SSANPPQVRRWLATAISRRTLCARCQFLAQFCTAPQTAWVVKQAFPQVAFQGSRDAPFAVQVTKPLAMLMICEVRKRPVSQLRVPLGIARLARQLPGEERGNERFVMRPPELHVVPVLLHRFVVNVAKVKQAAILS